MECRDLIIDGLNRVEQTLKAALRDLSAEQLVIRPGPKANTMAWLAWHLTRVEDDHVSELAGREQAWIADGWHAQFDRPADPGRTGYGHSAEDVTTIRPDSPQVLIDYYAAVHQRSLDYLQQVSSQDMDRVIDTHWNPPVTVGVRLVSVVNDTTQHVGQMAYLRGLIAAGNWSPF